MATFSIPAPYRPYTDGAGELTVDAGDVAQALDALLRRYPGLRPHLMNPRGNLRPFVNLFVNDVHIRELQGLDTPLAETDVLRLVPSIAGGVGQAVSLPMQAHQWTS